MGGIFEHFNFFIGLTLISIYGVILGIQMKLLPLVIVNALILIPCLIYFLWYIIQTRRDNEK